MINGLNIVKKRRNITEANPTQTAVNFTAGPKFIVATIQLPVTITAIDGSEAISIEIAAYLNPFTPYRTPSKTNAMALIGCVSTTAGMMELSAVRTAGSLEKSLENGKMTVVQNNINIRHIPKTTDHFITRLTTSSASFCASFVFCAKRRAIKDCAATARLSANRDAASHI